MPRLSSNLLPTTTVATIPIGGSFIVGTTYKIRTTGTTDFTLIGAADSNVGTVFTATGAGLGTGSATEEFIGAKYKGDGFYNYSDGLHTIAQYLVNFVGTVEVQGALTDDPVAADWVTLNTLTEAPGVGLTSNTTYNFTGNFVWIRAITTDFTQGTITKIQLNH